MSAFGGFFDGVGTGGADFLPIVKFDSRSGRISRRDRNNGETTEVDITKNFKAIIDFPNVEVGFINFATGGAPDFRMVRLSDGVSIDNPGDGYQRGVRFVVKLSKECGGDVREFASKAAAFLDGAKKLADAYNEGVKSNPDKLPVVVLKDVVAKTSGEGARKSTNYVPVWEIIGWVPRPSDLTYKPRNSSASSSEASASLTPPSTGSTKVSAPADDDMDFG
jgi:hypothetical protein